MEQRAIQRDDERSSYDQQGMQCIGILYKLHGCHLSYQENLPDLPKYVIS